MKVYIIMSFGGTIHGVTDNREKAAEIKKEADYDLGLSGSLYESQIYTHTVV